MSFRQDRTNPASAVSNWKGRTSTPKAHPSTAISTWLNSVMFAGASRPSWFAHWQGNADADITGSLGHGLDTSDNIYLLARYGSGYFGIAKIDGGDTPTLLAASNRSTSADWDQVWDIAPRESDDQIAVTGLYSGGYKEAVYMFDAPTTSTIADPDGPRKWYQHTGNTNAAMFKEGRHMQARKTAAGNSTKWDIAWGEKNAWGQAQWFALTFENYSSWGTAFYGDAGAEFIRDNVYHEGVDRQYITGMHDSYSRWRAYGYTIASGGSTRRRADFQNSSASMSTRGGYVVPAPAVGADKFGYFMGVDQLSANNKLHVARIDCVDNATTDMAIVWARTLTPGTGTSGDGYNLDYPAGAPYCNPAVDSEGNVYVAFSWTYASGAYVSISRYDVDGTFNWSNIIKVTASGGSVASDTYAHNMSINSNDDIVVSGKTNMGSGGGAGAAGWVARLANDGSGTGDAITLSGGSSPGGTVHYYDNKTNMTSASGDLVSGFNSTHDANYSANPSSSDTSVSWAAYPITAIHGSPLV